ncbi:MAG: fructokinase [Chloroflexota bacterium]|jgi:fructokinase|nr:fructokinase [Chloroflexota bacterium]
MIVVAGESLIDLVVRDDGSVDATPGGGPYNVARTLGRLGRAVAFVGRLSTDRFGRILRDVLATDGVDLGLAATTDDPTLLAIAELDDGGAARYRFDTARTAAAGLIASDVPGGLPATTVAFHVGTLGLVLEPMAATIEELVATAPSQTLVLADPNCRPAAIVDRVAYRARLDRVLARVDVVKASTDDLAWLEPGLEPTAAVRRLLAAGPAIALLTDGPRAVRIVTASGVDVVAVPAVRVVDTIGAGDSFGAGFLAAWTAAGRGRTELGDAAAVRAATRFAVDVAARTVGEVGAGPPNLADLRAALRDGYASIP